MSETTVTTGKVRFSYVQVFEPKAMVAGYDEKYSVSLIIPKKDTKTINAIKAAIQAALEHGKHKFGGKVPRVYKSPLRDGDTERDDEAYADSYFINASAKTKPQVVDSQLNPILNTEDFYSGCFGRANITFYAFSMKGNQGIACGLNSLQKREDGPRLDGRLSVEAAFGDSDDDDDLF